HIRPPQNVWQIRRCIISSIAPSIYGCQFVKTVIALSLFGGWYTSGSLSS
ncbi:unnamed protein product, partial [Laminaria digitata]